MSKNLCYCNFCGKSEDEVKTIVKQSPSAHICDECAELAHAICLSRKHGFRQPPPSSLSNDEKP